MLTQAEIEILEMEIEQEINEMLREVILAFLGQRGQRQEVEDGK